MREHVRLVQEHVRQYICWGWGSIRPSGTRANFPTAAEKQREPPYDKTVPSGTRVKETIQRMGLLSSLNAPDAALARTWLPGFGWASQTGK